MSYANKFLVEPKTKVKLNEIDPSFKSDHASHQEAQEELNQGQATLRKLQELFYADGPKSLLICLQGMDTAGKDGTINHIFGAMNPQGCSVVPFKEPSREEKAHDFLWRIHQGTPRRGQLTIFNRSHYEDVLVVRVHKLVPESVWSARYDQINNFEKTWWPTIPTSSSSSFIFPRKNSWSASRTDWKIQQNNGKSAMRTIPSGNYGTTTRPPMKTPSPNAAPSMRPGM